MPSSLTLEQKRKFPPICPDFVLELLSSTDNLNTTQAKMQEYLAAVYGWAGSSILKIDKLRFTDQGNLLKSFKHQMLYLENLSYQTLPST